jgi:hypothetical protein
MHSLGHFVEVQAPRLKQNIADAAKYAKKAYDLGKQIMQSATASPETLRAFDRQVSVAKAHFAWRIANRENFSRPGVKAKFDTKVGSKGNKSAMIAKNGPDADASWLAWVVQHHGEGQGESVLGTMRSYSTEARAKAAALRGLETSGLRGGFSRPAAKAKA